MSEETQAGQRNQGYLVIARDVGQSTNFSATLRGLRELVAAGEAQAKAEDIENDADVVIDLGHLITIEIGERRVRVGYNVDRRVTILRGELLKRAAAEAGASI